MKKTSRTIILSLFTFLMLPISAQVFDAAADFSPSVNPNGSPNHPWAYGISSTLGGNFELAFNPFNYSGLDFWNAQPGINSNFGSPWVVHNGSSQPTTVSGGFFTLQPGQLALAPGSAFTIVRWVAPKAADYTVDATFSDPNGTVATTDVHIFKNGTGSLFNGFNNVNGDGSSVSSQFQIALQAGETLDFIVGNAGNGGSGDHTALAAQIAAVPEPAQTAFVGSGLLMGFALLRKIRRRKESVVLP